MEETVTKLLVVIDPVQEEHLALNRAIVTVPHQQARTVHIHLYVALDMDQNDTSADNPAIYKDLDWFARLVKPIEDAGITYTAEMSWSSEWYTSIRMAAERCEADLIMLPVYQPHSVSLKVFSDSVWRLIRTAPCPVLSVRRSTGVQQGRRVVLLAVNFQSSSPEAEQLNEGIIACGKWFQEIYGSDLHIVNAYEDSLHFPDRSRIIKQSGVDNSKIHIVNGRAEDVILDKARELDADLTVLGIRKRFSRWRGSTADRIVNRIGSDLLLLGSE